MIYCYFLNASQTGTALAGHLIDKALWSLGSTGLSAGNIRCGSGKRFNEYLGVRNLDLLKEDSPQHTLVAWRCSE